MKNSSLLALLPVCLLLWAAPAWADCFTTGSADKAKACRQAFLSQADQSLNSVYAVVMKAGSADANERLRGEQRAWLKERDQTCGLAPGQTNRPDWQTAILDDEKKSTCMIQQTLYRIGIVALSLGYLDRQKAEFPRAGDGAMYVNYLKADQTRADYLARLRQVYDGWDIDKDGALTMADLATGRIRGSALGYWGADIAPGQSLTWDSVAAKGSAYFDSFDRDHDGTVSADEMVLAQELQLAVESEEYRDERRPDCELPKPTPDAQIILASSYEAVALASVGMHNSEVRAGVIRIAPGDMPLYVLLPTYRPVIWRFEGDVGRIQRVILSSFETGPNSGDVKDGLPMVGAVGLKPSQIFFAPNVKCVGYFDKHPSRDSVLSVLSLTSRLGRLPDVISANYAVAGFSLPDGAVLQPDKPVDGLGWRNLRAQVGLFYPGGVVPMDPAMVVSSQTTQTYDVLPGVAGLRQLVERGALVALPGFATYRVTRQITLPAGLYGASLAKFIVPDGVPVPQGDPGHSCIISESGKTLGGMCRN